MLEGSWDLVARARVITSVTMLSIMVTYSPRLGYLYPYLLTPMILQAGLIGRRTFGTLAIGAFTMQGF